MNSGVQLTSDPGALRGEPTGVCKGEREEPYVLGSGPMVCTTPLLARDQATLPTELRTPCSTSSGSVKVLLKEGDYLLLSFGYLH